MTTDEYLKFKDLNQRIRNLYYALNAVEDGSIELQNKTKDQVIEIIIKAINELEEQLESLTYSEGA